MEILSLKDSVEKDTFFRKLPNLAEQLPRQIVLKKVCLSGSFNTLNLRFYQQFIPIDYVGTFWFPQLLPLLASALEFGSAAAPALTALLKMGSWLSAEEFRVKVNNNLNTSLSKCLSN
jgi:SCY1-like protein 1